MPRPLNAGFTSARSSIARSFVEGLEPRTLFAYPVFQGSTTFDTASQVAVDGQGNTIVAGLFSGTADFQPGSGQTLLTAVGDTDIFVAKYSATGRLQWVRQFGGVEGDIKTEKNIVIPTRPSRASNPIVSVGTTPASLGEYVNGIAVDVNDNVYITGSFIGSVTFNAAQGVFSTPDRDYPDIFLLKLTTSGSTIWARQLGGRFTDVAEDVAVDAAGDAYITGMFSRTADLNPSAVVASFTALGRADIFVAKFSATGVYVWGSQMGSDTVRSTERESGNAIVVLPDGDVAVTGTFGGTADFDPSPFSTFYLESDGGTDAFVTRLSGLDGSLVWAERTGGKQFDGGVAIATNAGGTIYTAGYFEDTADVNPGTAVLNFATEENRFSDVVISRLSGSGALLWARQLAGTGVETVGGLSVDAGGNVTIAGAFYGTADFDPFRATANLTSLDGKDLEDSSDKGRDSSYDGYLWKLSATGRYQNAVKFGGTSDDFATAIVAKSTTQFLVAGRVEGSFNLTIDGTSRKLRSAGRADLFVGLFDEDYAAVS